MNNLSKLRCPGSRQDPPDSKAFAIGVGTAQRSEAVYLDEVLAVDERLPSRQGQRGRPKYSGLPQPAPGQRVAISTQSVTAANLPHSSFAKCQ